MKFFTSSVPAEMSLVICLAQAAALGRESTLVMSTGGVTHYADLCPEVIFPCLTGFKYAGCLRRRCKNGVQETFLVVKARHTVSTARMLLVFHSLQLGFPIQKSDSMSPSSSLSSCYIFIFLEKIPLT